MIVFSVRNHTSKGAQKMYNFGYFFRGIPDGVDFMKFGQSHFIIILLSILIGYLIVKHIKQHRSFELFIGIVLLIQQATLYLWYFINDYNVLTQGLPLYHCRISILLLGIGLIFNKQTLMKFGGYWGIIGSIFALLVPCPDPFLFPHITLVSYFVGHMFLLWGSLYVLCVKKVGMSNMDLRRLLIFTNVYCIAMYILNYIIGSNYGYMNSSPIPIGHELNHLIYGLIVMFISNLIMCLIYIALNGVYKIKEQLSLLFL